MISDCLAGSAGYFRNIDFQYTIHFHDMYLTNTHTTTFLLKHMPSVPLDGGSVHAVLTCRINHYVKVGSIFQLILWLDLTVMPAWKKMRIDAFWKDRLSMAFFSVGMIQ